MPLWRGAQIFLFGTHDGEEGNPLFIMKYLSAVLSNCATFTNAVFFISQRFMIEM